MVAVNAAPALQHALPDAACGLAGLPRGIAARLLVRHVLDGYRDTTHTQLVKTYGTVVCTVAVQ